MSICLIRVRRELKQRALPIDQLPIAPIPRAAARVGEAHTELLVPAQHLQDNERVAVFAVQQVQELDFLVAGEKVAAAGARPGGDGLIGVGHEVRGLGCWWVLFGWGGGDGRLERRRGRRGEGGEGGGGGKGGRGGRGW